jgi:hypothetical protein
MRTYVKLRELPATNQALARKVKEPDQQIATFFSAIEKLLALPASKKTLLATSTQKTCELVREFIIVLVQYFIM